MDIFGGGEEDKAEESTSMSESRRSDEDVIELAREIQAPNIVISSSETGRPMLQDDSGLQRRRFSGQPDDRTESSPGRTNPSEATLNPLLRSSQTSKARDAEGESLERDEEEDEGTDTDEDSYDSAEETTEGGGEDESSDASAGEDGEGEPQTWVGFLYSAARISLPYVYMIFISLALAYFLYLIDSQQREIRGLQTRIQSIEQVCTRKRSETVQRGQTMY
ncbi:hypothetical protein HOP50_04g35080 [Chloropicon primus]|uniref:Uncharacterized protein n=1 Tax=Chloropicon primus TaxID=1764295 RepID=A0A5B8MKK2_9CHLO|nr:hypothetical protein A3770_04p35010 [Chloropicon primus]UPR00194.1 hypothetical protein HOP50_04g35080 [Chloropicon primus]|eukprot:QDZ20983.1 hypothetical protein A3770_04p35010 [Chloropicon primus]